MEGVPPTPSGAGNGTMKMRQPKALWNRRLVSAALLVGLSAACPTVAFAATKPDANVEAEVLARTATELFKLKQFDKAAQLFMQAYGKSRKAALVYNAARAYEEAGKLGDAAALFRLYVSISDDVDGMAEARSRLKAVEARAKLPSEPPGPEQAAVAAKEVAKPVDAPPGAAVPAAPVAGVARSAGPHKASRTVAWIATGGSVALLGGSAALFWLGAQASHDANQLPVRNTDEQAKYNAAFDRAENLQLGGAVALGLGLAAGGIAVWQHLSPVQSAVVMTNGRGLWLAGRW